MRLHNGRGLAAYTHVDQLYQAYFTAYLVLSSLNAPLNPGIDTNSKTQNGFGTFGPPDFAAVIAQVAKIASMLSGIRSGSCIFGTGLSRVVESRTLSIRAEASMRNPMLSFSSRWRSQRVSRSTEHISCRNPSRKALRRIRPIQPVTEPLAAHALPC